MTQMDPKRPRTSLLDSGDHPDQWPCTSEVSSTAEGNRTLGKGLPSMAEEAIAMEMAGQEYQGLEALHHHCLSPCWHLLSWLTAMRTELQYSHTPHQ